MRIALTAPAVPALAALAALAACGTAAPDRVPVCVSRPEQHDRLNISRVSLRLIPADGSTIAYLDFETGGKEHCAVMTPGPATIAIQFGWPYGREVEKLPYSQRHFPATFGPGSRFILDTPRPPPPGGWSKANRHLLWEVRRAR